jgi:hypothetical protein
VKDRAEKTQRQPDKFAEQCAIGEYESNVIKYVMTDISSQIGVSTHSSKTNNEMLVVPLLNSSISILVRRSSCVSDLARTDSTFHWYGNSDTDFCD